MKARTIAIALMAAALLSCSPYSTGKLRQADNLPSGYGGLSAISNATEATERWWEAFEDPRLDALMQEAFNSNPDVEQYYAKLLQMQAVADTYSASLWPSLNAKGSGGRLRQQGMASDSYSLSLSASYEIDLWRRIGNTAKASVYDALASEQDLQGMFLSLSGELAEQYFTAVEMRSQMELDEQAIRNTSDNLRLVEFRYAQGLVDAQDVYRARQSLHAARAKLASHGKSLNAALSYIAALTGRFPGQSEIGIDRLDMTPPAIPDAGVPSALLELRPDVRASWLRVQAKDYRVAAAVAKRFPSFTITGSYGGSDATLSDVLKEGNIFWSLLMEAALPIIDGGSRRAEVRKSKAELMETLSAYKETVIKAYRDVIDAMDANRALETYILELEGSTLNSENIYRLALGKYQQGLTDYMPVQSAEQSLFDSRGSLLTARHQLISARIQLAKALGASWTEDQYKELISNRRGADEQ